MALVVLGMGLLAVVQGARGWVPFDYDLLELNDPSSEGVTWEKLLIEHDQRASFVVSIRPDLNQIARLREQYEKL